MTAPTWSLIMVRAFAILQGIHYRRLGRSIQGRMTTANPGVGILGAILGEAAVLIHGTPIAMWPVRPACGHIRRNVPVLLTLLMVPPRNQRNSFHVAESNRGNEVVAHAEHVRF